MSITFWCDILCDILPTMMMMFYVVVRVMVNDMCSTRISGSTGLQVSKVPNSTTARPSSCCHYFLVPLSLSQSSKQAITKACYLTWPQTGPCPPFYTVARRARDQFWFLLLISVALFSRNSFHDLLCCNYMIIFDFELRLRPGHWPYFHWKTLFFFHRP